MSAQNENSSLYTRDGVDTHMTSAVVNLCIQMTFCAFPGMNFIAWINAFPSIALTFAIISAAVSKNPAKREMSLRFASRAATMNILAYVFNGITLLLGTLCALALFS